MDVRRSKLEQGEERTERVTAMEEFFEEELLYSRLPHSKEVWWTAVGESLVCKEDPENASDCGCEKATIIGHLTRKVSQVCSLFLRRGDTIECTVTANWVQEIFS